MENERRKFPHLGVPSYSLQYLWVKKCLNICHTAWQSKKNHSWHSITITATQASIYWQLADLLQGFIRVLFTICICLRQATTSEARPQLEEGDFFFLLPWALPSGIPQCCSAPVTSAAKPLLAKTGLQKNRRRRLVVDSRRSLLFCEWAWEDTVGVRAAGKEEPRSGSGALALVPAPPAGHSAFSGAICRRFSN